MSHATGLIKFQNGSIFFFEYNGTSDTLISHIYNTPEEVYQNWRDHETKDCCCGNEEAVSVFSSYANGFYLEGIACSKCKSLRPKDEDFDTVEREDVFEDWAKEFGW